ncbi:MAG: hypothetical protein VX737_06920 [Pseudomonadota bacterium]|nr:hypothetical protein [Pseudomonadota bacterium]
MLPFYVFAASFQPDSKPLLTARSTGCEPVPYFFSNVTMPLSADYVFDTKTGTPHQCNNVFGHLKPTTWSGTKIIFVRIDDLPLFASTWLPKIRSSFLLITAGDDYSFPTDFMREWKLPRKWSLINGQQNLITTSRDDYTIPKKYSQLRTKKFIKRMRIKDYNFKTILENPNLKAWYTQNLDNTLSHPKLKPLPLGINFNKRAASQKEYNSAHDQDYVLQRTNQKLLPTGKRKLRVFADTHLVNSSTRHRSDGILSRFEVHKILENNPLIDLQDGRLSRHEQWAKRGEYVFSLSLVGNGYDCHRTWESLALGNIVLLQSSPLDPLFEGLGLPVIIIHDWTQINEKNLQLWAKRYGDAFENPNYRKKLTSDYWIEEIYNSGRGDLRH